MMQLLMPLCQQAISGMLPQPKMDAEYMKPLAIQMDDQFAAMAERYFDNLYDGRMPVPHQFKELVRRCCEHGHEVVHRHGNSEHGEWGEKAPHRVFMAAVDRLIMTPSKADEIISEYFEGVTDEERRVIKRYAKSRTSTHAQAQAEGMTDDAYTAKLESLMTKTK